MSANDVVCTGAEPLFFLDYVVVEKLVPEQVAQIVAGVAEGCRRAGCALLGGETAEHPGTMPVGSFDLAGFCVGIVREEQVLSPARVRAGRRAARVPVERPALQRLQPGAARAADGRPRPVRRRARAGPAARGRAARADRDLRAAAAGAPRRGAREERRAHHRGRVPRRTSPARCRMDSARTSSRPGSRRRSSRWSPRRRASATSRARLGAEHGRGHGGGGRAGARVPRGRGREGAGRGRRVGRDRDRRARASGSARARGRRGGRRARPPPSGTSRRASP